MQPIEVQMRLILLHFYMNSCDKALLDVRLQVEVKDQNMVKYSLVGSQIRTGVNRRNTDNTVYMYIWTKPDINRTHITEFRQFQSNLPPPTLRYVQYFLQAIRMTHTHTNCSYSDLVDAVISPFRICYIQNQIHY